MKSIKEKKNLIKEQILERNNRIEKYITNLLNKNTPNNSYISHTTNPIINISKEKANKSPPIPKIINILNSKPKISKIHQKKINNELNTKSYILFSNNNNNNIKYIKKNFNNFDNEDILSNGTGKNMATIGQYTNDNKENININTSYMTNMTNMTNSTHSYIDLNKNFSFINNKYNKNNSINNNSEYINKNVNFFLKKIPKLKRNNNNNKKGLNSFFIFKNNKILSVNDSNQINHSYMNLNRNKNSMSAYNDRKNINYNINNNCNNISFNNILKENNNENNISLEKSKTIDAIRTIKKVKNPTIFIIDKHNNNTLNSIDDNFVYNKKNNYSSFSYEKKLKNKSYQNNLTINNMFNRNFYKEMSSPKDINLEDFLLIIQKFEIIKSLINSLPEKIKNNKQLLVTTNKIRIKIYDLYKYYLGCTFEGKPETFFNIKKAKINLHYYSIILVLSLALVYILTNKVKMTQEYFPQIINLFNFQQKLFLLLSDMVIHKIKINSGQKMWAREIMNILNNKLMFNTENYILDMKKINLNSYYLINEILVELKFKNENGLIDLNEQEIFFMNFYFNNNLNSLFKYNISNIEEIFNNNIFSIFNLKSNYANIASRNNNKSLRSISTKTNPSNIIFNDLLEVIIPLQKNSVKIIPKIPFLKFPSKKEYTLILDLDETLIYFKLLNPNKRLGKILLRPGLINFLEIIKEFYEIIIFTSGTKEYADIILNIIEKKGDNKYFDGRLYREHNVQIGQKFYKDLSKIGRALSRTIIVDNFNHSFKFQKDNGILISSFYGDSLDDKALIELQKILIKIYNEKNDVRKSIIKYKEEIFRKISCLNK